MNFSFLGKLSVAWALFVVPVAADVIETTDGSRLVGTVTGINGGQITLSTSYAGDIDVALIEVAKLTMDSALSVRLADGTIIEGTIISPAPGQISIEGDGGSVATPVTAVVATWAPGGTDPAIIALQRQWAYEASADLTGKSGNSDNLGTAVSFRADLQGADDHLFFYARYNQQESDGVKSADEFQAGVDYSNLFRGDFSWYVRNEAGFDYIKDIEFYEVAAAGLGFDAIGKKRQQLLLRGGLSFRYETYGNAVTEEVQSAGLDFGLSYAFDWETVKMRNSFTFVPTFADFGDFRATHDTHIELPLASASWKLRLGLSHHYLSQPVAGFQELDTTWYTRLVLDWD